MRNSTRKQIETHLDTGIGGVEVTITVEYPATPGGATEAFDHLMNAFGEIRNDLLASSTEVAR